MKALLLIGPTGSGKSPLGNLLEQKTGWYHFDFGNHLRAISSGADTHSLSDEETADVKHLVDTHALFPPDKLFIIQKILNHACDRHANAPGIILNGMPRTVEQADALELDVAGVVELSCTTGIVVERVRKRHAGETTDHAGRSDDTLQAVQKKLATYDQSTRPLIEYYRAKAAPMLNIAIEIDTLESDLLPKLVAFIEEHT